MSDSLVDNLYAGNVVSIHGIRKFIGDKKVELNDSTVLNVDAVILCTGYDSDFSLFPDFNFSKSMGDLSIGEVCEL